MKILLFLLISGFPVLAMAQTGPQQPRTGNTVNTDLLDTTRMYASRYGNVARATQDNMPCILPYNNNTTSMPNTFKGNRQLDNMPNLWRNRKLPGQPIIKKSTPYIIPKGKWDNPDPWKKDTLKIRPIR